MPYALETKGKSAAAPATVCGMGLIFPLQKRATGVTTGKAESEPIIREPGDLLSSSDRAAGRDVPEAGERTVQCAAVWCLSHALKNARLCSCFSWRGDF
jgi:hypothetical protein